MRLDVGSDGIEAAPPGGGERHRQWRPAAACTLVYIALAMLEFGHFGSLGPGHMSGIGSPDVIAQVWWLAWAAYALTHGHNLFLTTWLNYPAGQNFGDQGSLLALGQSCCRSRKRSARWSPGNRSAFGSCRISDLHVPRAPPMDHLVAGRLRRRSAYGFSAYINWYAGGVYLFLIFVRYPR